MTGDRDLLAVVPARGGSVGIRRKNLRLVDGRPLVVRAGEIASAAANQAGLRCRVVVTTDDRRIAAAARAAGLAVVNRPPELAAAGSPVNAAVDHAAQTLGHEGPVALVQPTCAALGVETLHQAITLATSGEAFVLGVVDDRHIRWTHPSSPPRRVNRQWADPAWRETGWWVVNAWTPGLDPHRDLTPHLLPVPEAEAVDVDTHADLAAARAVATRRHVVVVAECGHGVGTGHLRRQLLLADLLDRHDLAFDPTLLDDWAAELVEEAGWPFAPVGEHPDLVIIDTANAAHVASARVVFETPADPAAALVINDMLPATGAGNELAGWDWSVLDPLYRLHRTHDSALAADRPTEPVVAVTFGGTDPAHLTQHAVDQLADLPIQLRVIAPPAGDGRIRLPRRSVADIVPVEDPIMAGEIAAADLAVTSRGRTPIEAASVGTPVVATAVNGRELGHMVPPNVLPVAPAWQRPDLAAAVGWLLGQPHELARLAAAGLEAVDGRGVERVAHAIEGVLLG